MAKKELKEEEEAVPGAEEKDGLAGSKAKKAKFRDCEEGREFECRLCDCKFFTVGQHSVHIQSFEHRKRTIQKMADSTFDQAPQYQGGREGHLPPGLSGRKVVHCKVCNVFTNSAKQLAEHLGGSRHKQLCFKFNVPVTTLALTKEDTHTLEATRLQGDKLMCKHCSVEINSMQQYQEHMNSAKHKLRAENKPLRPERSLKKALKAAYKTCKKRAKEEEGGSHKEEKKDKGKEETEEEERKDHASSSNSKAAAPASAGELRRARSLPSGDVCGMHVSDPQTAKSVWASPQSVACKSSVVRDKYQLNLLDQLSELPTLRNEMQFYRHQRPPKEKKPAKVKPVPFMCDVCQVFTKSAFELNEHLMGEEHRAALKKFLVDGKASSAESQPLQDADPAKEGVGEEELPKKPELYCDACQLLLPSLGAKREHEKGKKHKFLQELKKGMKTEPRSREGPATAAAAAAARGGGGEKKEGRPQKTAASKSVHCNLCMVDVESEAAMKEHIKSKKHRFLSELKPEPEPVRRPEAAPKRKRPWPHDSSDRDRRGPAREDMMPELAAVALERQVLQAELAKRRREIDEQRRLIDDLREEQHLEQEKAALRRMIDECRQLIEEREMRKRRATEELYRAHKSRSVRWHPSVETEHSHSGGSNSSSHEYWSFSMRRNEEIPLLGMPPVEGMSSVEDRWSGPSSDGPFWETDRSAPVSRELFVGSTSTAHSPFGPSTNSWPGTQAGLLPDWPSASQEPDWQRPVLCSPPNTVGLLGDRPPEWGPSAPLLPPGTETHTWGGSSTTRIPGLDFV